MATWVLDNIHAAIEEEYDMEEWISQHYLTSLKPAILEHKVSLDEFSKYTDDEIEQFSNAASLNQVEIVRLRRAIRAIQPRTLGGDNFAQHQQQQVVSPSSTSTPPPGSFYQDQKDEGISTVLTPENSAIQRRLHEIALDRRTLHAMNEQNKLKLNRIRSEVLRKLNHRFNVLVHECNIATQSKQEQLRHEELVHYRYAQQQRMMGAHIEPAAFLANHAMADEEMAANVFIDVQDKFVPSIEVIADEENIFQFIDTIGTVIAHAAPDTPVFRVIEVSPSAVSLRFANASKDTDVIVQTAVCGKRCDDERKFEWTESKYVSAFDDESVCTVVRLKQNQKYFVRARYRNGYGFSAYSPCRVFRTKKIGLLIDAKSGILGGYEKQTLCNLLNARKFPFRKMKCLYSSIKDGFDVCECHRMCQNHENIMFIIHTSDNNLFGAFTATKWITNDTVDQKDDESFVFVLRSNKYACLPQVFDILCRESMAIWYHAKYFCLMGTGYDISIYKTCDKSDAYTYACKGNYNMPSKYYLNGDKKAFTVVDIEIFTCLQ